jgi:hypothetical protein
LRKYFDDFYNNVNLNKKIGTFRKEGKK